MLHEATRQSGWKRHGRVPTLSAEYRTVECGIHANATIWKPCPLALTAEAEMCMQAIRIQPPVLLDPRPPFRHAAMPLAPRLPTLQGQRLLLFDNGRLPRRHGQQVLSYATIERHLRQQYGVGACRHLHRHLPPALPGSIRRLAAEIAASGVAGVVLALCDEGATASTIVLAWELESHRLPTVTVCSGQALHLAAAMSLPVLPGLPLSQLNISRHAATTDVAAETIWVVGEIGDALTTPPAQLQAQFLETFAPLDTRLPVNTAGELQVWSAQTYAMTANEEATLTLDPAQYAAELYEAFCDSGLCDGLPVIPPTRSRVEAMLAWADRPASERLVPHCFPSGLPLTVGTLAVNAVMAGCRPEYFPILLTAALAVAEPRYRLMQALITSHPAGNAIVVSGPLADEIGLASGGGCLGPGFRANVTIGRALNLSLVNAGRALPGQADLSTLGSPAELTFCCAENVQASPWPPLHVDLFDAQTTTVTVLKCEAPHNVLDHLSTRAESLVQSIADVAATLGGNNAYVPAELLVLLNPQHAHTLHADGWSKQDVQRCIFEQARHPRHLLHGRGIAPMRPKAFADLDPVPVVPSPEDVLVLVAGAHGPHSMVAIPWGYARAVTKAVTLRDGRPARHINDFYHTS
jgi:hypothetical protein